jgi:Na+-translocating ferredoxin:NAD+ oxidoreductase RnfD subunit
MTTHRHHHRSRFSAFVRFWRSPKGLMLAVLLLLAALAAPTEHTSGAWANLAAASLAAMLVDLPIVRVRDGRWTFPSGAWLTGLFVAMLLSPHEPWWVAAVTAAVGVASKYVARTRSANVFNPAALGIVLTFYAFGTGQSWWGALPDAAPWLTVVLVASGIFIADRVNKVPLVLVFLGVYYALFAATAFAGNTARVAEIFRPPDVQMALFFACFILTDPPTSPVKYRDQIVCAAIVAVVSYLLFQFVGAAYYLLGGVLAGNVWEARRRVTVFRARRVAT